MEEQKGRLVSVQVSREGTIQIHGLRLQDLIDMLEEVSDVEVMIEAEPCAVKGQKEKEQAISSNIESEHNGIPVEQILFSSKKRT